MKFYSTLETLWLYLIDEKKRFIINAYLGLYNKMPDDEYLMKMYFARIGKHLDLENPQTFNEKLQWLKLYAFKPQYSTMVDKYAVKKYIADKIGEKYIIPTLGIYDHFDEIDFNMLPKQFVLKCTHDSGGIVIVRDKTKIDKQTARKKLEKSLKKNYYYGGRELPYKYVLPKIIAEEYIQCKNYESLPVYKFFCFNGKPQIIQAIQNDKKPNESIDYFDVNWNLINLKQDFPNSNVPLEKPKKLLEMLSIAEYLSNDIAFIRIDLYLIDDEIKFSEFTFYSDSGFAFFEPEDWDKKLGDMLILPR